MGVMGVVGRRWWRRRRGKGVTDAQVKGLTTRCALVLGTEFVAVEVRRDDAIVWLRSAKKRKGVPAEWDGVPVRAAVVRRQRAARKGAERGPARAS